MSRAATGHVLIGVVFFGKKYKYICLVAGCVCVRLTVRGERSSEAGCLSHMIYDPDEGEQRGTAEYEKVHGRRGGSAPSQLTASSGREETAVNIMSR